MALQYALLPDDSCPLCMRQDHSSSSPSKRVEPTRRYVAPSSIAIG
jgi:hypothetical protein